MSIVCALQFKNIIIAIFGKKSKILSVKWYLQVWDLGCKVGYLIEPNLNIKFQLLAAFWGILYTHTPFSNYHLFFLDSGNLKTDIAGEL